MKRRNFIKTTVSSAPVLTFRPLSLIASYGKKKKRPDSRFQGVQIGVISYSWRSMPCSINSIIKYCVEGGINSLELMGDTLENFAGIPPLPNKLLKGTNGNSKDTYKKLWNKAVERRKEWRLNVSMKPFIEVRRMFNRAGIDVHLVKFSPADWSDKEVNYAFKVAKVLGAKGVSNEIGHDACRRLGKFAEKHNMYAVFHNHCQPASPKFNFEEFLSYSSKNMLNFDVGHFYGATGIHPNEIIKKLHNRIFSIHLKDKTGKNDENPNINMPWGEGKTPIVEILKFIRKNRWPIYCDIELEYDIPENSNAQKEIVRCLNYCQKILS